MLSSQFDALTDLQTGVQRNIPQGFRSLEALLKSNLALSVGIHGLARGLIDLELDRQGLGTVIHLDDLVGRVGSF